MCFWFFIFFASTRHTSPLRFSSVTMALMTFQENSGRDSFSFSASHSFTVKVCFEIFLSRDFNPQTAVDVDEWWRSPHEDGIGQAIFLLQGCFRTVIFFDRRFIWLPVKRWRIPTWSAYWQLLHARIGRSPEACTHANVVPACARSLHFISVAECFSPEHLQARSHYDLCWD